MMKSCRGFTLIELVIVLALLTILMTAVVVMIDPVRQFAQSRNNQRWGDLNLILGVVAQNKGDNKGSFSCASGPLPTTTQKMAVGVGNYDIAQCLIPLYLQNLPYDPATSTAHFVSVSNYDTGYTIMQNSTSGRITVAAPAAELGQSISVTR